MDCTGDIHRRVRIYRIGKDTPHCHSTDRRNAHDRLRHFDAGAGHSPRGLQHHRASRRHDDSGQHHRRNRTVQLPGCMVGQESKGSSFEAAARAVVFDGHLLGFSR